MSSLVWGVAAAVCLGAAFNSWLVGFGVFLLLLSVAAMLGEGRDRR